MVDCAAMDLSVVEDLLPSLAANRDHWPLWTYERRKAKGPFRPEDHIQALNQTWFDCNSWPERIAWSIAFRLEDIYKQLADLAHGWGIDIEEWIPGEGCVLGSIKEDAFDLNEVLAFDGSVYSLDPAHLWKLPVPGELMLCFDPDHFPDIGVEIPALTRLETLSVIAQYAPKVSNSATALEPVGSAAGFLDSNDRSELAELLVRAVLVPRRVYGRASDEVVVPPPVIVPKGDHEPTPYPVASEFTSLFRSAMRGTWEELPWNELRTRLGAQLLQAIGLVPERQGGPKQSIGEDRCLQLYEEAIEISDAVRSFEADESALRPLIEFAEADSRFGAIELARARRALPASQIVQLATRLRYPFLRESELVIIADTGLSTHQVARKLILNRLPRYEADSDSDDRAFQNLLSKHRSSLPD